MRSLKNKWWGPQTSAECLLRAQECRALAANAATATIRKSLILVAQAWTERAEQIRRNEDTRAFEKAKKKNSG